jgi:hypothetical protein
MSLGTRLTLTTGLLVAALILVPASAFATSEGPGWELSGTTSPTNITQPAAGRVSGTIVLGVYNIGAASSQGTVTVTDVLPAGVRAADAGELRQEPIVGSGTAPVIEHHLWNCTGNGPGAAPKVAEATVVTCTNDPTNLREISGGAGNPNTAQGGGGHHPEPEIAIAINAQPGAEEHEINRATIAGGGAPSAAGTENAVTISAAAPPFGPVSWDGWFSNADGTLDTQAGSHPYAFTTTFTLATQLNAEGSAVIAGGEMRNVEVELPPGVVGNPTAVPQCSRANFDAETCSIASEIGVVTIFFTNISPVGFKLYNLVPPPGVPAEFAFTLKNINTYLDASVRSGSDYGITQHVNNISETSPMRVVTTVWGDPGDPSHNRWRTGDVGGCTEAEETEEPGEICAGSREPLLKPFLTLPTACGKPQPFVLRVTSWSDAFAERAFYSHNSNGPGSSEADPSATGFTGCGNLAFGPTLTTAPDTSSADTPAGLTVDVKPALGGLEEIAGDGTSDIKGTTVTLPPGFVINPGQAAGLQACGPSEDGLTTEAEKAKGEEDNGPPSCPNASKVGTVTAKTPLLEGAAEKELSGNVYVLNSNPPDIKLLAAFSADGVNIKLVLDAELNEQTGQITTKVINIPEAPVSDFKLSFSGGAQAALDTPAQCGTYTTTSDFTPWSSPFVADAFPTANFAITAGPGGGPCPSSPLPFTPSLVAGSTTDQAGAFTNFSLLLQRGDGQQRIERLQFREPAGLAGLISSVPLCPEPEASQGACPASSHIGHAVVASGPGPYPLVLPQPGAPELPIYLTGPYKGAPFGLSIVTPVIAGPFNLGTIITRASIAVDPRTAQITITTDPLPQVVAGVPTDLREIQSVIDRPGFLFNPTNCTPASFEGTAWGTPPPGAGGPGASAPISSHFGVGSCQSLKFTPKIAVTTSAKSSKASGASLNFKISYPAGALGTQSWFKEAKFDLPKQLPARLTTLQKGCVAKTFEANPAACPLPSLIGHAIVKTPVLPVPLAGPVYFVSYGGAKFPDAVIVLQGDGVNVDLTGETFINGKTGITSATFAGTPDVPFESIEVSVPSGPFSEFAANLPASAKGSFCGQKLTMPTRFVAQNGLEINQGTNIAITGCAKARALTRAQKLAKAMKACKKDKKKGKRASCEKQARRKYGPVKRRK